MSKLSCAGLFSAALVVSIGIVLLFAGGMFVLMAPYYLVLGWIYYLVRVLPEVRPDPATVATAAACLAVVTLGCHWFGQWLWGNVRPDGPAWSWWWTARVVAVVVLLFAAGTAAVGIVHQSLWLVTAKEPLIDGGMRPIVAKNASANKLKQIGLAAHNIFDEMGVLPISTFAPDGRPMHSWQTALLPYIDDQQNHYKSIDLAKAWDHPVNRDATAKPVKVFLHPAVESTQTPTGYSASHYAANVLTLGGDRPRKLSDFTAGTSNTLLYGEAVSNPRAWADPLNWRDPRLGLGHSQGFGGPKNQKGTQFCFADGSVRTVDLKELNELLKQPE